MKEITLWQAVMEEKERKYTYMNDGIPYQPRIYYIKNETVNFPAKDVPDPNAKHFHLYNKDHWMVGNIIVGPLKKYKDRRRQRRNYAIFYSIDGVTSHSMTKEAVESLANCLVEFKLKRTTKKIREAVNTKNLKEASVDDLVSSAKSCLSELCKRTRQPCNEVIEHEDTIRYFLERSIVRLIPTGYEIKKLMEHVIQDHEKIIDCRVDGFKGRKMLFVITD